MAKKKPLVHTNQRFIDLRLGIKLKDVFWPFDTMTLADTLSKLGYENIQQSPDQRNISAEKKHVRFYLDQPKLVFGFHSDTPDSLITTQKEFFASIDKEIPEKLESHVRFYELEHKAKQITEKNTYDTVQNLFTDSSDIHRINQIVGLPVKSNGINVIKEEGSPESDSWYQVEVIPLITSAPNTFICRLLYRDPSAQTIYNTMRKTSKVFEELSSFLESKD